MKKEQIYEKFRKLVIYIVKEAKFDAEDLAQDTFLSFFEHYEAEAMEESKIRHTLCLIAQNKLKNFYKKEKPYEYIDRH